MRTILVIEGDELKEAVADYLIKRDKIQHERQVKRLESEKTAIQGGWASKIHVEVTKQ